MPEYRGDKYWEQETPEVVETGKARLAYYKKAGKLQVQALWTDRDSGERKAGKVVTLDVVDLRGHGPEARELLLKFFQACFK